MYRKKRITGIERCVFAVESAILMREFAYEKCVGGGFKWHVCRNARNAERSGARPAYLWVYLTYTERGSALGRRWSVIKTDRTSTLRTLLSHCVAVFLRMQPK